MGTPPPLINHAQAFLKLLDPTAGTFCFRTFADNSKVIGPSLSGNIQGNILDIVDRLQDRNTQGAGVFVVINEGGQKKSSITRVRAVFADTDGADLNPVISALPPHIVVNSSPGRWHVYWLVIGDFPLEQFRPVQLAIAEKYGTDMNVADLSRVMRLPGFYHNKVAPHPVRIITYDAMLERYSFEAIAQGLNLSLASTTTPFTTVTSRKSAVLRCLVTGEYTKSEIEEMLRYVDPSCGRKEWMDVLFVLAFELGDDGRELANRWSRGDLWTGANQ